VVSCTKGQEMKSEDGMSEFENFSAALGKVLSVSREQMKARLENGKKPRRKVKRAARASRAKD
jgi:hypothetical protein